MKLSRYQLEHFDHSIYSSFTDTSFFASAGFLRLWQSIGGRPVVWAAEAESKYIGLLPGIEFGKGPVRRFQAMPDGCYGRIYFSAETPEDERQKIAELFSEVLVEAGYAKLFLFDFHGTFVPGADMQTERCSTQLVDISGRDWQPPDKKLQSEIRKSEREGVVIENFDRDRHMPGFLDLMQRTEERHGRGPKYPPEFFKALSDLAAEDPRVIWTWCEHEGEAVSSHISFVDGTMVLNWQVYFDKKFSFLKANQLMLYSLAREMAAKGITTLNLGASPPEADSLSSYKEKWGAQIFKYPCYSRSNLLGRLV